MQRPTVRLLPASGFGRVIFGTVVVAAGAVGILAGREIAYSSSIGGLASITAAVLWAALILGAILLAAIAGILRRRRRGMSSAIVALLVAAALLPGGGMVGVATAGLTGGTYRPPVVLESAGSTRATVDNSGFVTRDGGAADCRSVDDGQAVAEVTALDLGELLGHTLRATISLSTSTASGRVEAWIDGGDLPEGQPQPFWGVQGQMVEMAPDGASGEVRFENLPRESDAGPTPGGAIAWPPTLTGSIAWACQPW
jgi:hypothetical protein